MPACCCGIQKYAANIQLLTLNEHEVAFSPALPYTLRLPIKADHTDLNIWENHLENLWGSSRVAHAHTPSPETGVIYRYRTATVPTKDSTSSDYCVCFEASHCL